MSHSLQPHGLQHTRLLCPTLYQNLLKFMSTELVMISNHLTLCHPLLLPSIFPSIRVIFSESALPIRWPNYWSFTISLSNEYSGFISFNIEWFDLLAVQGILKSLLQHHNSKASLLRHSAFFMVQLSNLYIPTGKTIALTIWIFIDKVVFAFIICQVCHILSSKELASCNFMTAVTVCSDFGAQENKICYCFHLFPIYLPWSVETRCHDFSFKNIEI